MRKGILSMKHTEYKPIYRIKLVRDKYITIDSRPKLEPNETAQICRKYFKDLDREHLLLLMLDAQNKVIGMHIVSTGTINQSGFYIREIIKACLLCNCTACIIAHNHPSARIEPSEEDLRCTQKLKSTLKIMGITLHDSLIVGDKKIYGIITSGKWEI